MTDAGWLTVEPAADVLSRAADRATATVAVEATVLWSSPSAPRDIDALAVAEIPDLIAWADGLGDDDRLGLLSRADTQALLGEPVIVVGERDGWSEVRLPLQPSWKDSLGYPGWIPSAHLTEATPPAGSSSSVVTGGRVIRGAWLDSGVSRPQPVRLGLGTILPRLAQDNGRVTLLHPRGGSIEVADDAVSDLDSVSASDDSTVVLEHARVFEGLPYLWAGSSGAGVDCSGLVHLASRASGLCVPRDADDQGIVGDPIAPSEVVPGDPVFFAADNGIHHVALSTGGTTTFHAPRTGLPVGAGSLEAPAYRGELVTARRFLR